MSAAEAGSGGGGTGGLMRVDELSGLTGVSIRNIREYQDRGLLPAPAKEGRIALYDGAHAVRLRLIVRLLARGYTLAVIRDLLDAWDGGRNLHDVLGLEEVVSRPWGDAEHAVLTRDQVNDLFAGRLADSDLDRLVGTGVLVPLGDGRFACTRVRLVEAVPVLIAAGVPIDDALATLTRVRTHMDAVAQDMVALVVGALLPAGIPQGLPEGADVAVLSSSVSRLRTVAESVAANMFGLAMTHAVDEAVNLVTRRALEAAADAAPAPSPPSDPGRAGR